MLMIFLIYFSAPFLLLLVLIVRASAVVWKLSFEQLNFFSVHIDVDNEWLLYVDYDTDSNFYFRLLKGEWYLWFNCYFFFNFNGGETIVNELDFLDIIAYNAFDMRNFRYLYRGILFKQQYDKNDYFFLYQFNNLYIKRYNLKRNLKLLNNNTYNVLNNSSNLDRLYNKKKYYYIK
jgi:hypothetical protein